MDIDYANDKGSYAVTPIHEQITLDRSVIITWSDYKRNEGDPTYGLLSQVSPDGKWIVFCKAKNYMLLQPDSELYIIPAEGGEARRLRANTTRMNSWHSFSPNGKWLVFSGKPDSPYTRLFLTHIDEQGQSTPAVVLDCLTSPDRAANIPEFVNTSAVAIRQTKEKFVDDLSYARAAWEYLKTGDCQDAERLCRKGRSTRVCRICPRRWTSIPTTRRCGTTSPSHWLVCGSTIGPSHSGRRSCGAMAVRRTRFPALPPATPNRAGSTRHSPLWIRR